MKKIIFITIASFITAALLSYSVSFKNPAPLTPECYTSCFSADVLELSKAEAATPVFAMLHEEPLAFTLVKKDGEMISFNTPDGKTGSAYEIKPQKKTKNFIIVVQEWWGLNDYIKQEADKLYCELDNVHILAVDLYDGKVADNRDSAMKYMSGVNNQRLEDIIKGAIAYAGPNANIYTIGWCFGGMWSLQTAILAGKQGAGCVMYYGRPETNQDKLKQLNCDVIGFFGNKDRSPSPEMVDGFVENMKTAGENLIVNRYDAGHGFANPSNPGFNKDAREDAWKKTIKFYKERMR